MTFIRQVQLKDSVLIEKLNFLQYYSKIYKLGSHRSHHGSTSYGVFLLSVMKHFGYVLLKFRAQGDKLFR